MKQKHKRTLAALAAFILALAAFPGALTEALPGEETREANTRYQPAFEGQTRAPGLPPATFQVRVLSEALNAPWAVTALPDGRLAITEKAGFVRLYSQETGLSEPIPGITGVWNEAQGGLLDLAPAPDFTDSRLIYFTLALQTEGGSLTALGRGRLSDDERAIEHFEILWRAGPAHTISGHYGSRIALSPDGLLFISTGDRQDSSTRMNAQQTNNGWGKIVRLTLSGEAAPGNPFEQQNGALPEVWSLGHRNVQGLAIHPQTGELWASEMGPRGGDELNRILPGHNYGWPVITYGIEYSGEAVGEGLTAQEGMEQPVYYWDPVLAASGMDFYAGDAIPDWHNDLFIAGLGGSHVSRLKLDGNQVVGEEWLLADEGQRFRDVADGRDGALYIITDQGRLYRLGP